MLVLPACRVVFGFWVFLVFAAYNCWGEHDTVQVVGGVECADCGQHNIKTRQAFKGLKVTIHCKSRNGKLKTRGAGEVDQEGTFRATLPNYKIAKDGREELKEACFARLHGVAGAPCAVQNNQKDSKVVLKSKANGKHVLGLINGSLKISRTTCPSAFLWLFPFPNFPFYPSPPHPPQLLPPPPQPEDSPPPSSYEVPPPAAPEYNNPPPAEASPPPQPPPPLYNNPPPAQPKASPPRQPRPRPPPAEPQPLPPPPLYNHPSTSPVYSQPPPSKSPAYKNPTPQPSAPSPDYGQLIPPPSPVYKKQPTQKPISTKPLPPLASPGKSFPDRIPKAPPIPQLPRTPATPRKFFNKPIPPSPYRA